MSLHELPFPVNPDEHLHWNEPGRFAHEALR